jgi:hypothetical protein
MALYEQSKIFGSCDHGCVSEVDVVSIGVVGGDDTEKSRKFGHDCEEAHGL